MTERGEPERDRLLEALIELARSAERNVRAARDAATIPPDEGSQHGGRRAA